MENFRILDMNMDDNRAYYEGENTRCGCRRANETARGGRCCEAEYTREGRCCENERVREGRCCENENTRSGRCCESENTRSGRCCENECTREADCCRERETTPRRRAETHNHEVQGSVRLAGEGCEEHNHRFATVSGDAIAVGQSHVHNVAFTTDTYDGHSHEYTGRTSIAYPAGVIFAAACAALFGYQLVKKGPALS